MKLRSVLASAFLFAISSIALAQRVTPNREVVAVSPAGEFSAATNDQASRTLEDVLAVAPVIPRGPLDVLREYRDQMTVVSQSLSMDLVTISQGVRSGQITRADAEYLIQQRSQLALMQYEVFSALHDILAYELAQDAAAAVRRRTSVSPDSGVVVVAPPWSCTSPSTAGN